MGACCNASGSTSEFETTRPSVIAGEASGPDDQMMKLVRV